MSRRLVVALLVGLAVLAGATAWWAARPPLVPAVAVPVVLLGTFGVLAAAGYSINTLTLFALVLVIKDAALWLWGAEDLLGPRAPGLQGAVDILGRRFPTYDLLLIVVGPAVLGALWLLLTRTRWGTLVRAATQDREMVGALGVNQAWLFTSVFALGAMLAGLHAVVIACGAAGGALIGHGRQAAGVLDCESSQAFTAEAR